MDYSFNKKLPGKNFEEACEYVTALLKTEGFGIISEIDVQKAFKEKINVEFRKYKILGACNPHFAHQAILAEDKIGVFLPCNVVLQEHSDGSIEVMAMDPIVAMSSVKNEALANFALEVQQKIKNVIDSL